MTVDVIFLSNAKTPDLRAMTQRAIDTCVSCTSLPVHLIVLEQQECTYRNAVTRRMLPEFHFNMFANYGARMGESEWIMIANNDLIFHDGWLEALLDADHPVVSPKCPARPDQVHIIENTVGDQNGTHFSGWCFMIRRDLWKQIGGFDEAVSFWCSDNVVIEQVKALGIAPMLVPTSRVEHIGSVTLNQTPDPEQRLTQQQLEIFKRKYR